MRNLIIALVLFILCGKIFAQNQNKSDLDTIYCIQLMSTRNIHLVKPEMVAAFDVNAYYETSGEWNRVLIVCANREEADTYLYSWQRQHKGAFIVLRNSNEVDKMLPLFTY